MLRSLVRRLPIPSTHHRLLLFNPQRELHSRNKKAKEFIARGWGALKEVDRVIDHCEIEDPRLVPYLRKAKENFELALEADNSNTQARYWLAKLHMKYHVPGKCLAIGVALLVEAANMGDADAQYELGCHLRFSGEDQPHDQKAYYFLEKAADQLQPNALFLLGAVYLAGDCVNQDLASAMWCFHRASDKGHPGAAVAYGALLLRGVQVPEYLTKFNRKVGSAAHKAKRSGETPTGDVVEMARRQFEIAAGAGCDLGFKWLNRLEQQEKPAFHRKD
ncbi:hypothetical protein SAY87_002016 [Trapa incisa]|uniref:Binding protein n=1 Tax=Trapa incisa TaxID=236973 RepID=A0AAN7JW26_9MYRT|nr:hypothetical protein SAY87_002016 [Trapa incisa]